MQQRKGQTSIDPKLQRGLCIGAIGLVLGLGVFGILFIINGNKDTETSSTDASVPSEAESTTSVPHPFDADSSIAVHTPPELPHLDFPPGSVEEACGFNDFVWYHDAFSNSKSGDEIHWPRSLFDASGKLASFFFESDACRTALDNHVKAINPYLWGESLRDGAFAFFELDNPLTLERIFTDPLGDFNRVKDALDRPECLLRQESGSNWELQESCHADAFTNYALLNRFCFHEGVRDRTRTYYREGNHLTPEQDRFMWKQALEGSWVRKKCEEISPDLKLTRKLHSDLIEVLVSMEDPMNRKGTITMLIELAARLGDEAAGLTQGYSTNRGTIYLEHGVNFGRFRAVLSSRSWKDLQLKKEPSRERLLNTFQLLVDLSQTQTKFDWSWLVQHLCTPPYVDYPSIYHNAAIESETPKEPLSCRAVINELYTEELVSGPVLEMVDQFERTALELELYD